MRRDSRRVHSYYRRRVSDLPLAGRNVQLLVIARRFRRDAVLCGRQIFTERLAEGVLAPSARRASISSERFRVCPTTLELFDNAIIIGSLLRMLNMRPPSTSRREFIQGLATAILTQTVPKVLGASVQVSNEGLSESSVFAWQDARAAETAVDFWTAQLGMVETDSLPASARVIVKWSEVCLRRAIHSQVSEAKRAITDYYGIAIRKDGSNSEDYVRGKNPLSTALTSVCTKARNGSVALVDIGSRGLSNLDWADIIPLLKHSYKTVIGVDYAFPELDLLDPDFKDLGCPTDRASWSVLMACDEWRMTSDDLLSPNPIVSYEQRAELYTAYVSELIRDLSSRRV